MHLLSAGYDKRMCISQSSLQGVNTRADGIIAPMTDRARVYTPMTGWRLTRWLLFYAALVLFDAAVIVAVIESA